MPMPKLKENATQEEINAWIVENETEYNRMETQVTTQEDRIKSLEEHNQKLFLKITDNPSKNKEENKEDIPSCIDKEIYDLLSNREIEELKELIEEGEY